MNRRDLVLGSIASIGTVVSPAKIFPTINAKPVEFITIPAAHGMSNFDFFRDMMLREIAGAMSIPYDSLTENFA